MNQNQLNDIKINQHNNVYKKSNYIIIDGLLYKYKTFYLESIISSYPVATYLE